MRFEHAIEIAADPGAGVGDLLRRRALARVDRLDHLGRAARRPAAHRRAGPGAPAEAAGRRLDGQQYDEGRSFIWTSGAPGLRTTGTHLVEPSGDGARATARLDQEGLLGGLVGRLSKGLTERYLAMEAAGLKARSEG